MKQFIFLASLVFCFSFLLKEALAQKIGQARIDSLREVLDLKNNSGKGVTPDTNTISLLISLAYEYHKIDPDSGIKYGKLALDLSNKINWKPGISSAYNRMGLCYWAKSDFPKSLENHFAGLKLAEEINDKKGIATICGNIGLVYNDQQDFSKALEYHFKALKLNQELNDKGKIALNLGNIGIVYDAQGNYEKSLEYYLKALKLYEELNDKGGVARNLGNIGFVYQELNDQAKALEYYYKALEMNRSIGNKILTGMNLGNIGETYYMIANDTLRQKNKTLPDSLRKHGAIDKAGLYLKTSIATFEDIQDYNSLSELYQYLSDLESLSGNYRASLDAYKKHVASKDSVFNENNKIRIEQLEKNREEDLKQKQIELLKSQNKVDRLIAQRSRGISYGLAAAFIALGFVAFAFFHQSKKRKRINKELETAYDHLKTTQQQLIQHEKLASLGALTAGIAHEIKNPLNFVNNFSEVSHELVDEFINAEDHIERKEIAIDLKRNLAKINEHGRRADSIVKNMLEHSRTGKSEKQLVDLNQLCDEDLNLAYHGMRATLSEFNCAIEKNLEPGLPHIHVVSQDINRVILNLLTNAFYAVNERKQKLVPKAIGRKFENAGDAYKPNVSISTISKNNKIEIKVKDNGSGIPNHIKEKIFEPFFTTKPTGQGTGLGLSMSYDIIKAHNGELNVLSKENEFTEFIVTLPV